MTRAIAPALRRRDLVSAAAVSLLVSGCGSIASILPDSLKPAKPAAPGLPDVPGKPGALPAVPARARSIEWTIVGAADVNPDDQGRPSPVAIRLYQLKSADAFVKADFFALFEHDAATLGADLLGRDEVLLVPGGTLHVRGSVAQDARFVAAFAGYRNYDRAAARTTLELADRAALQVRLQVGQLAVRFDDKQP